jgi:protein tyrosine/serine phosphatase
MKNKIFAVVFASFVGLFGINSCVAQTSPGKFDGIKISNFGKMDDRFYRGARPGKKDFAALKAIGIDTIIDLTDNTPEEKGLAEAAGLKYVNIPIVDKTVPTDETIATFLKTANDPATGVFYVHCAGGRHRTGDIGAIYRLNQGWDYDKTYAEMENYDFYTSNGHGKQKDFVVEYAARIAGQRAAAAGTASVVQAAKVH